MFEFVNYHQSTSFRKNFKTVSTLRKLSFDHLFNQFSRNNNDDHHLIGNINLNLDVLLFQADNCLKLLRRITMPAQKGEKIESKYEGEKLYALIKEGKDVKQIMTELGIRSKPTLNNHLFKLMRDKKEYLEIAGTFTRLRASSPTYKNGRIVLSKNMLGAIEFNEGQKFTLKKTEDGLKLKMI